MIRPLFCFTPVPTNVPTRRSYVYEPIDFGRILPRIEPRFVLKDRVVPTTRRPGNVDVVTTHFPKILERVFLFVLTVWVVNVLVQTYRVIRFAHQYAVVLVFLTQGVMFRKVFGTLIFVNTPPGYFGSEP